MGRSGPGRIIALVVSVGITLAVSAILYYWFREAAFLGNDYQSTFEPASDNAEKVQSVYVLVFWLAGAVFVGVMALTLAFALMFREQEGAEAVQSHGNSRLEILWTFIPVVIVVAMAVPTFDAIVELEGDAPEGALEVEVVGHQWWFEFRYGDEGIVTATDLHIPVDRAVHLTLLSGNYQADGSFKDNDVIHSFWVPRLMGKKDIMPGHENHLWFTPSETGTFLGQCAEFCGLSHAKMRFRVIVHTQEEYDAWVAAQQTAPAAPTDEQLAAGQEAFTAAGCIGCHAVEGVSSGLVGPNLTHVGSRSAIAGGWLENTPADLESWIRKPSSVKPGSHMPDGLVDGLSQEQVDALVAYLQSLK